VELFQQPGARAACEHGDSVAAVGRDVNVPPVRADDDVLRTRQRAPARAPVDRGAMNAAVSAARLHQPACRSGAGVIRLIRAGLRHRRVEDHQRQSQHRKDAADVRGAWHARVLGEPYASRETCHQPARLRSGALDGPGRDGTGWPLSVRGRRRGGGRRARAAAGDEDVNIMGGADVIRQALDAGIVDRADRVKS
jgi:hypothetical protein